MFAERIQRSRCGFTLVEIMIVVAIIGLLTVLAIPSLMKARKQSQGRRILNDTRMIDSAIDQTAMELSLTNGSRAHFLNSCPCSFCRVMLGYLKENHMDGLAGRLPNDILGNQYAFLTVGPSQVTINAKTKLTLAGVGIDWGAY
jgi:prepilin-type N-terminal cleavage/methylation domain-containing protein